MRILQGVKLYREVRIGSTVFRGAVDTPGRTIDYVFDLLPSAAVAGKSVLDLGTAGGAVCFEAVRRGARHAVGVEMEERRIRGARFIKRTTRLTSVEFVQEDFWQYLRRARPEVDVVFVLNVLHHLGNPFPMLRRIVGAARERIVIEIPVTVDVEEYHDYGPAMAGLPGEGPIRAVDDITQFLALYDFVLEREHPSPPEARFCGHDEVARAVYVYSRLSRLVVKSREERAGEIERYRAARDASWDKARSDPFNIDCRPDDRLSDILGKAFGDDWTGGRINVLLCGPPASGKSHYFEGAAPGAHPPYHYKIFKFPNDKNQGGLRRHLNPRPGEAGKIAQVMLSSVDGPSAHCTAEALAVATTGRAVVCLLLNVAFDTHFDRLYRRQADRVNTADAVVDYEAPLQFDCAGVIDCLRAHGCPYRVLTIA